MVQAPLFGAKYAVVAVFARIKGFFVCCSIESGGHVNECFLDFLYRYWFMAFSAGSKSKVTACS